MRAIADSHNGQAIHPGAGRFDGHMIARWFCKVGVGTCALNGMTPPSEFVRYCFRGFDDSGIWIGAGVRKEIVDGKTYAMNYLGKTSVRTHDGGLAVARHAVEFLFSVRSPEEEVRRELSPAATWEEQPPRIVSSSVNVDIVFEWPKAPRP